jgi:4-diphosphocytidyl-2-C-methyl-D-erythritol kinase
VSTRDVFQAPELTRNSPVITIRDLFTGSGAAGQWRNDCEPVVRHRFPEVGAALDWLSSHAPARLTGTGSCVFAEFARAEEAEAVAARVPCEWRSFVAQGLATSPLHARLRREVAGG